jgi:fibrillarin-like pre-rRNA processing protein
MPKWERRKVRIELPPNVKLVNGRLHTISTDPEPVYGERISRMDDGTYLREWNAKRSKLASAITSGAAVPLSERSHVLYLGAASGTTVSHVSDIAREGAVYAVEISSIEFSKLLLFSKRRQNIVPILSNARAPELYAPLVPRVDLIYQDVSQRDQVRIFLRNMEGFSCRHGVLCLKTKSIDATSRGKDLLQDAVREIRLSLEVRNVVSLAPYQKEHWAIITS